MLEICSAKFFSEKEFDPAGLIPHTFATNRAPVAQLDRVSASGAEGRGFESRRAYHPPLVRVEYVT